MAAAFAHLTGNLAAAADMVAAGVKRPAVAALLLRLHDMSVPPAETGGTLAKVNNGRIPIMGGAHPTIAIIGIVFGFLVTGARIISDAPLITQVVTWTILGLAAVSAASQLFQER